jgi:hypothetical protein
MNISIKPFETHSWKVQKINVSNGWKALEIRNKSHVGKKSFGVWEFMKTGCEGLGTKHV